MAFFGLFGSKKKTTEEPGFLDKLKRGIEKTREGLLGRIEEAVTGKKKIDAELLEELEFTLLGADLGMVVTTQVLDSIRGKVARREVDDAGRLKDLIRDELLGVLERAERPLTDLGQGPAVILVVGVNGAGKTTTIGKLAHRFRAEGRTVMLAAGDTFRAAAIEQLEVWGERTGTDVIRQKQGSDPSAVLFDAVSSAKTRGVDVLIADTAGRLHTKDNLMAELEKIRRTVKRVLPEAPHETLLVLDATTGQNGLEQARKFTATAGVTGIVLTKLDGTAKGGVAIAISRELDLPIRFIGVGEQASDLLPFDAKAFVDSLLNQEARA
jgi:fused signal recognition particle receptor